MSVTAADVKALRDRTGAAMMDCKAALTEAEGDVDRAIELLRVKGQASAAKREGRGTNEGVVASYIHANDKVGAMVEVQCETDFVARNEDFKAFAYEVALHVAATAPRYVSSEEIPEEEREAERRVFEEKAREEGKPDNVVEKIVEGQLAKWAKRGGAARPGPRQRREARLEDDRGAAPGAGREDRREHPHRPLRLLPRRRGLGSARHDRSRADRFGRILLKLSGEALMGELEYGTDAAEVERIAAPGRARCASAGWRSRSWSAPATSTAASRAPRRGWTAPPATTWGCWRRCSTRSPCRTRWRSSAQHTRVMSAIDVKEVAEPYIRRRAMRHLEKGRVVIFAAGTGNPFFTTDTAAALRALEIHAEAILMAKNGVEGVYDADPATHPEAKFIPAITHREAIERGLKVMDSTALSLCMDNDLPIYVFNMGDERNIDRIVCGERVGTLVSSAAAA